MFITQEVDFEGIQETREEKVFLQTSSLFPLVLWICVYKSESNNWTDQQMWNPDVEGSLLIVNRSTNVKPRCTATGWTPWECRPAWTTSTQVWNMSLQLNHFHFLSHFLPRNLILISHNLRMDHFFLWRRRLIDVMLIFRPQQWTDHIPGKKENKNKCYSKYFLRQKFPFIIFFFIDLTSKNLFNGFCPFYFV